ncbi:restriction endonuclease subunit S [Bacillus nitroreducens]
MSKKPKKHKTVKEFYMKALVSEDDQLNQIKENWSWVKLGSICDINMGQSPKGEYTSLNDEGVPLIGGPADMGDIYPNAKRYTSKPTKLSKVGDLIVSVRATLGKTNISNGEYCLGRGVAGISSDIVDVKLLRYYFEIISDYLYKISTGTTFSQISRKNIEELPFPLAPAKEQKRILSKVERLLNKLDGAKKLIEEAEETFEHRRIAILDKAFRGELTVKWRWANHGHTMDTLLNKAKKHEDVDIQEPPFELPKGWKWVQFHEIVDNSKLGLVRSSKEQGAENQYFYIKMNNITSTGELDLNKVTRVDLEDEKVEAFSLKKGDFLFNTRNSIELVGKSAVFTLNTEEPILFNNNILRVRFVKGINPQFINYYFNSFTGKRMLNALKSATTNVAAIYAKNLNQMFVPIPPIAEQEKIVNLVENILEKEKIIGNKINLFKSLDLLKESILNKAFRGELGTNDSSEESAFELLKEVLDSQVE